MTHPYLQKKSSRFNGFISCPCLVLSISQLSFCGHGELNEYSQIIQTEDVTHAGVSRWTQSDLGGVHMRFRHAPLTSQTMPPLPHSQSNGVHSQIPSSLKPRLRDPNTTRLTVPFLFDWTSILPPRLLKTEPPTDATPCLLIYQIWHPVATTTPHNVSGNADGHCAPVEENSFLFCFISTLPDSHFFFLETVDLHMRFTVFQIPFNTVSHPTYPVNNNKMY